MEVDCYCERRLETINVNVEDLFSEEESYKTVNRLRDNDRITLYGRNRIIVNMNLVTAVEVYDNVVIFHFMNGSKLIVNKSGEITYSR